MKQKVEIPGFLAHLKVYNGYPITYVTFVDLKGVPDFTTVDHNNWLDAIANRKCGICGYKMEGSVYFIGGEKCAEYFLFKDPAMHLECAEFSMKICPYIFGTRPMKEKPKEHPGTVMQVSSLVSTAPPKAWIMVKSKDQVFARLQSEELYTHAADPEKVWTIKLEKGELIKTDYNAV